MKISRGERVLAALLWCYPPSFRRAYSDEILQFVRRELSGGEHQAFTWLLSDAVRSLPREWLHAIRPPRTFHELNASPPGEPMRNMLRDVRLATRLLSKSPGFTLAAVLTLALGIGANTAIFTLADATLLRPVHATNPEQLVVWSWTSSYPDFQEYAKRTDIFQGVLGAGGVSRVSVAIGEAVEVARATFVTSNAFEVLGVRAAAGRTLLPSDEVPNGPIVTVLEHDYWRSRFGADPAIVGRSVEINGRPATIVGVAERGFRGTSVSDNPALFLPTAAISQVSTGFMARFDPLSARRLVWLRVIGRLQPSVTADQASAAMTALYTELQGPPAPGAPREMLLLRPLPLWSLGESRDAVRMFVTVLVGTVVLTLLAGCANLANLLLAKSAARRREMGVRLALGATRGRVLQQALIESLLLAGLGGIAGLAIARTALELLSAYQLPGGLPIGTLRLDLDTRALSATFALSLLTGVIFGALPAWRASRTDVLVSLREHSRAIAPRGVARHALLAIQLALSVVLLTGSGLFARALAAALDTHPGFDARGVLTASVNLGIARYEAGAAGAFYATALARVKALPDVTAAAWTNLLPTRGLFRGVAEVEGYAAAAGETVTLHGSHVGAGYFRGIGTRIVAGREFTSADHAAAPKVGIVNDVMARKYWPGGSALGRRFRMFDEWITVVGVSEPTVVSELREAPRPQVYFAFDQWLGGRMGIALDPAHLVIRTQAPLERVMPMIRERLRSVDPNVPLYDLAPLEASVTALVMPQRMGAALFTLFSALALTLAVLGIYSVATYVATLRTREIGVRIALGATRRDVLWMIVRDGLTPVAVGIVAGLVLALYASRLVESFLHGISRFDPLTFTLVPLLLALLALAATYVPARRASRIPPVDALRD